jgi:lycopene cyclase domain-containing protein
MYGEEFFLNIRFITIPLEDYLFGFSLLTSNIVLWEYFKKREKSSD